MTYSIYIKGKLEREESVKVCVADLRICCGGTDSVCAEERSLLMLLTVTSAVASSLYGEGTLNAAIFRVATFGHSDNSPLGSSLPYIVSLIHTSVVGIVI